MTNKTASLTSLKGYPPEILKDADKNSKYLCNICKWILRNPVQSPCGHRFCTRCVEEKVASNNSERVVCPACEEADDIDEEASYLSASTNFPDNAVKRDLTKLKVNCNNSGCHWAGIFKDFEIHYTVCEYLLMTCEICSVQVPREQFTIHMSSHSATCPFKCSNQISGENLSDHLQSNAIHHLDLVRLRLDKLESVASGARSNSFGDTSLRPQVESLENGLKQLRLQMDDVRKDSGLKSMGSSSKYLESENAALSDINQKINIYENVLSVLNTEIEKLYNQVEATSKQQQQDREQLKQAEERIKVLERQVAMKDAVISELDLRVSSLEQTSYNGTLLWRINNMKQRRQDASTSRIPSIYSPSFYTSRTGYKVCARLYLNGDGVGKGSHVSLFFVIMRGQYDALLKWPFKQKVTLMFLDQNNVNHVIDAFYPDATSSSFKRPVTEMNIASGCPKLMPLPNLENSNSGYIKDDVSFIKIIVNLDGLE